MIRFLDLTNQTEEGASSFAFYDPVANEIQQFNGCQVFHRLDDFLEAYAATYKNGEYPQRYTNLIPADFFEPVEQVGKNVNGESCGVIVYDDIVLREMSPEAAKLATEELERLITNKIHTTDGKHLVILPYEPPKRLRL
jgi:hypothetical protein